MMTDDKAIQPHPSTLASSNKQSMTRNQAIETEMDPEIAVDKILAAAKALDRLTLAALQMTDSRCWDNMQGNPRLNAYGANLVAKKTGLRIRTFGSREAESGKDAKGPWFIFQCTGEVSHPLSPAVLPCQGTCDSRNQFHTTRYEEVLDDDGNLIWEKYTWDGKERRRPKKKKVQLQAHQVQRSFISQQAMTLCKTKGIMEYLGLDRLTWNEIEKYTQASKEDSASVLFKDNAPPEKKQQQQQQRQQQAPAAPPPQKPDVKPEDQPATSKQRTAVWTGFSEAKGWGKAPPEDASTIFFDWVADIVGDAGRDKKKWTVGMIDKMLKKLDDDPPARDPLSEEPPADAPPTSEA